MTHLLMRVTPLGHLRLETAAETPDDSHSLEPRVARRIGVAFDAGSGQGILHLALSELDAALPPSVSFWRDLGRLYLTEVCATTNLEEARAPLAVPAPEAELDALRLGVPPMPGGENVTGELLRTLWQAVDAALGEMAGGAKGAVAAFLQEKSSAWHAVGRVCLHLAENKTDEEYPFAFLATYANRVSRQAKVQHLPLGQALNAYAGARNKQKLLTLLRPVQRAAEQSATVRQLVDSGDIFQALRWTPRQAYAFLRDAPLLERSGVLVRMPDWWRPGRPPRPKVSVSVGRKEPSPLCMDSLLEFSFHLTLDGERLTWEELEHILQQTDGLALVKGRWVEVDPVKLAAVLKHWKKVEARAAASGLSFAEGMRLLTGVNLGAGEEEAAEEAGVDAWSEVVASPWLREQLDALRAEHSQQAVADDAGLNATLRPYQRIGARWLWTLRSLRLGGCLADDMGLGKTIQVLAMIMLERGPRRQAPPTALLVVPASLVANWMAEVEKFAPGLRALAAHPAHVPREKLLATSAEQIAAHDIVITTYGTLQRLPWVADYPWGAVVLDEAQAIKNPSTKQTRAVKRLQSQCRFALTGTPVENNLTDLWSIFDFINPGLLGSAKTFKRFAKRLAAREHNAYAPLRKLIQPYLLRRLKTDKTVIADLPDKTEVIAYCSLTKKQAALYQDSVMELRAQLSGQDGMQRRGLILAFLLRFKQICNHPSQWLGDGDYRADASGKLARLTELGEAIAARQDKVLVFTQFREMTGPLSAHLESVFGRPGLVLHGGTPVGKRQRLVAQFQEQETHPFMVLSLKAGGTGLNLTAASHVIHFDRWWNPAVENQATDRVFRIGQRRNVLVHKLVCTGTVEEKIDQLINDKTALATALLQGGKELSLTELSNEEILSLVSLDATSVMQAD